MFLSLSFASLNLLFLILYITGSSSFPKPLSAEEERKYLLLARDGDREARNLLVERNLRLVAHIIKKYYSHSRDQEDLISIGTIGLIKAINTFDVDKGIRLATYAAKCIENEILMYFRNIKKKQTDVSINDTIETDKDGNNLTLLEVLSCEDSILEDVELKMKVRALYQAVDTMLTDREKNIVVRRYGLYDTTPRTQREVAKQLGISRSYVSRIEKKALLKLRRAFHE
ncbi:RNA polymerase sporulation sigma factor SigK [Feifania hominis]|uniref:RNA polymerase sigma factor n=1 Tax=Feifania hominis TaxID=2763660 RepID=A0A926DCL0_9FIRM|nr:RNA polymerase sporulation sigma factor SigK [Feifania hominis]MBC8535344.1 RNA polymerase sporulation sigma factor SigK [Feifania hominis]